jgi:hypothetical protein
MKGKRCKLGFHRQAIEKIQIVSPEKTPYIPSQLL